MKYDKKEFDRYAIKHMGISSLTLHDFKNHINPTIIEERQLNITQMDVFSRLMMEKIIFLGTEIDSTVANIIQAQLLFLDTQNDNNDIKLYINSPGGSVYAGMGIYDTMNLIDTDVHTICTGLAASMGAILLAGGANGKRSALKHSRIMIHQPLGGISGQASDIEITAKEIIKVKNELYTVLSNDTKQSFEKIEFDANRDYWMTSQEALEYGMIDKILKK